VAEIDVERGRGSGSVRAWVAGLLLAALLIWALVELSGAAGR